MKKDSFKIIAIKPLRDCNPDYLKVLNAEEPYYFYNNYEITSTDKIIRKYSASDNLYDVNGIGINVSAIVGKNGSGKSTIIELLFMTINNLAFHQQEIPTPLSYVDGLKVEVYFYQNGYHKVRLFNKKTSIYGYDKNGNKIPQPLTNFKFKDFFYTLAVNYSHYAYNSNEKGGGWVAALFHKNDGYQTPLVINPMRRTGNIEINNENHLVKSRLLSNLLRVDKDDKFNFRKLTEKLGAVSLQLRLNKSKETAVIYEIRDSNDKVVSEITLKDVTLDSEKMLSKLNAKYKFNYKGLDREKYKIAIDYVLYKMVSIAVKYDDYEGCFLKDEKRFDPDKVDKFIDDLVLDDSHITFKLRQTLNLLRFQHINFVKEQTISLDDLSKEIHSIITKGSAKRLSRIELVPPPIFNIDIVLKSEDISSEIMFNTLSSGEKQMVYSVSSILYHIVNLDSISNTKKRTAYRCINIVLEEIELYFHPEMQRTYLKYILDSISRTELKSRKSGVEINFSFITHSPFILSDIPNSNIMFLKVINGKTKQVEINCGTFASNIHDLLADGFFMETKLIGDFASSRIQGMIDLLRKKGTLTEAQRSDLLSAIKIIGEPFLKEKLLEMYYEQYEEDLEKEKRIVELENQLRILKNGTDHIKRRSSK